MTLPHGADDCRPHGWVGRRGCGGLPCCCHGAIGAFVMSRTVGLFGFSESGLQPAPYALVSLLAELTTVVLAALSFRVGEVAKT